MTAQLADKLRPFGIDYVDAMDRFGDNAELYERLALKYLDDGHLVALQAAMEAKDYSEGYSQAHALKGVAGNLSFKDLYDCASPTRCTPASTTPPRSISRKWSAPMRSLSKAWKTGATARCRRGTIPDKRSPPAQIVGGLFRFETRNYSSTRSNISRGAPQIGHM